MQRQRRPSFIFDKSLGNRADRDNHRRKNNVSQPTDAELEQTAFSDLAEYQFVFQQLKQEFPTSASGALHQMVMARISEIKANQLEEQRERDKKEEEERPLNVLASKLVGIIKPADADGCRRPTIGSDSTSSLWNRRQREDLGASRPSMLLRMSTPSDHQASHSRRLSLFPRQDSMPPNDPDKVNFACRSSNESLLELDLEDDNMIGARSRRRSDISLLSDFSGLFDDENIDATNDHHDDTENIDLLRNDTNNTRSLTTSSSKNCFDIDSNDQIIATQFLGLDLFKNRPEKNDEIDSHHTNTLSITSVTSSDCCSTASLNGLIVGFSDQRTNDDENDLIVGFVNRRQCESPF